MKQLLITLTLLMSFSTMAVQFKPEFTRDDVVITEHVFEDKYALMRAMKKKPYRKLFYIPGQRVPKHHGFSIWYTNKQGKPIGECKIFYVKGDEKTRAHELLHCKHGNYHKGDH